MNDHHYALSTSAGPKSLANSLRERAKFKRMEAKRLRTGKGGGKLHFAMLSADAALLEEAAAALEARGSATNQPR